MKKTYTLLAASFFFFSAFATNYPGNGKTGFGGTVGNGSLDVSSTVATFTFKLNRGTADMNDVLVIYLDTKGGGITSTSVLTDGGTNRSVFNFNSPSFQPDFALAFKPTVGKALLVRFEADGSLKTKDQPVFTNVGNASAADYEITIQSSDVSSPLGLKFCLYQQYRLQVRRSNW